MAPLARHRSEQYFTCSQSRAHFFRQVNGRLQAIQVFSSSADLLRLMPFAFLRTPLAMMGAPRAEAYRAPPTFLIWAMTFARSCGLRRPA